MVEILITPLEPWIPLPQYAQPGDAGADLVARHAVRLEPGERVLVPTGLRMEIPVGYVGLVHPRSGLAARHGVSIVNAPGTIDAGYRGEVMVCLVNLDASTPVEFAPGDRIAQLVIQQVEQAHFRLADELSESARGIGGYGSTGGHASLEPSVHESMSSAAAQASSGVAQSHEGGQS